jgi:hypothetical protein
MNTELNIFEQAALSKLGKISKEIPQESFTQVDFTVRVTGYVKKGKDHDGEVWASLRPTDLLPLILAKLNEATRASVLQQLLQDTKDGVLSASPEAQELCKEWMTVLGQSTRKNINGPVTAKLTVEKL